jgi:hypothetical protein
MTGFDWTCGRCGMNVSLMPGVAQESDFPAGWQRVNGVGYCLSCSRKRAGEEKAAALSSEDLADLLRASVEGRIEFELGRAPDRSDSRVARACGTNVTMVRGVRERLGAYPTRPV